MLLRSNTILFLLPPCATFSGSWAGGRNAAIDGDANVFYARLHNSGTLFPEMRMVH
jgi:hypothetical protein